MTRAPRGLPDLPPGPAKDLVDLFRRLRHTSGVTHGQLALRTGLSRSHVSEVLSGWKAPRPATAAKIAEALRGDPDEIRRARGLAEKLAELNRYHRLRAVRPREREQRLLLPDPPTGDLAVQLLGPVQVESAGGIVHLGGPTARALFAALLLMGEPGATTEELISWVWGSPGAVTRASVYHYVSALRATLSTTPGQPALEAAAGRYRLVIDDQAVDWRRFRRLVADARLARDHQDLDGTAVLLRKALDLWRGSPLGDTGDRLDHFRTDMLRQHRATVEALAATEAARGRPQQVVDLLTDHLRHEPGREVAAALLIDALSALGRREEAGEVYRRSRAHLVRVSGLEPGEKLQAAFRRTLHGTGLGAGTPATLTAPPGGAGRDCGPPRPASGLPRPDRLFTGRTQELALIRSFLAARDGATIVVVSGMAGAGKTAFVVQAARQLADEFPDGVLFIDLHGYTDGHPPLAPQEALDRLLRRLGMSGDAIPSDVDERAALFADLLSDRRMLVVLDNACGVGQVRPLLPGAPGCAVVVTSRLRLTALDDAYPISLDVLGHDEAVELFRLVAGPERLRDEPDPDGSVGRVVERCGRLPLAVRIAASRHRSSRRSLADLEGQLSDAHRALAQLDDHDRSVAASFRISLTGVPDPLGRTFALLATQPAVDFDAYAAAATAGQSLEHTARELESLVERNLLIGYAQDRYRFHDLVAAFARQYAAELLPPLERTSAVRRAIDYYLRAAELADGFVTPHRYRIPLDVIDGSAPLPPLIDYASALAWLDTEQANLAGAVLAARSAGLDASCWQLACTLRGYFFLTKSWQPWVVTHETALVAARRCGDVRAEATVVNNLGLAHLEQGHHDLAAGHYEHARRLFAQAQDAQGEHTARANLAWHLFARHEYAGFLVEMEPILAYYRREGLERNAAITQRGIGLAKAALGRTSDAVADLRDALAVFCRLDLRLDIAMAWNGLGETYQQAGERALAADAFTEGLAASERCGSVFERARAHHRLGQLAADAADVNRARGHWSRALDDYRKLRAPQAAELAARLHELAG